MNKLTVALAISAGLLAVNVANAEIVTASTVPVDTDIIAACPLKVTPKTHQKCSKCNLPKNECGCKKEEKIDPCMEEKVEAPCEPIPVCEEPKNPTCATCPQPSDEKPFMQQIYSYPAAVYGNNQVIGERGNGVYLGQEDNIYMYKDGVPVARDMYKDGCGCNTTGAAAPIPCLNEAPLLNGIPVDRNKSHLDGNDCPMQIHTETSIEALDKSYEPYEISTFAGGAAPLVSAFKDVPDGFWASCDINKLTENNIIAGYPDRTFKPNLPVSRAEMASMTVKGYNLLDKETCNEKVFKDVPENHWANKAINTAVSNGMMAGYPNGTFKPSKPVSRAEAFTILSKGINCPMSEEEADRILSQYCDSTTIPAWAKVSVAKAINAGALENAPQPDLINPNKDASRAEIAAMLEKIRISLGYSNVDKVTMNDCGCTGAAAFIEKNETIQIPTLQLTFNDEINARSATVGDRFSATTLDDITINDQVFPAGSTVRGKVLEVARPSKNCQGALRLSFNTIENCDCKADLPQQVLTAQVNKIKTPNPVARFMAMPFTLTGGLLGTVGRTVGGALVSASNAVEAVVDGVGVGTGEVFQGEFKAAGRSYGDSIKSLVKAPIDTTRTAISGTMGLFQHTGDEIAYLIDPSGAKVSSVNPKEKITVAFGCNSH